MKIPSYTCTNTCTVHAHSTNQYTQSEFIDKPFYSGEAKLALYITGIFLQIMLVIIYNSHNLELFLFLPCNFTLNLTQKCEFIILKMQNFVRTIFCVLPKHGQTTSRRLPIYVQVSTLPVPIFGAQFSGQLPKLVVNKDKSRTTIRLYSILKQLPESIRLHHHYTRAISEKKTQKKNVKKKIFSVNS